MDDIYKNNYAKKIFAYFLIAAAMCLASCAQTVHIHPGNLAQSQMLLLQSGLEREGHTFRIHGSKHPAPEMGNLLIYHPQKNSPEQIEKLLSIFDASGITIDSIVAEKVYNHEYTKKNYGLYIRSNAPKAKRIHISEMEFEVKLTDIEYTNWRCDTFISLDHRKSAHFESISKNEKSAEVSSWKIQSNNNKDFLVVQNKNDIFQYNIVSTVSVHKNTKTYTTRLSPAGYYRQPFGCEYEGSFTFSQ